jgi:hypothetical protein
VAVELLKAESDAHAIEQGKALFQARADKKFDRVPPIGVRARSRS